MLSNFLAESNPTKRIFSFHPFPYTYLESLDCFERLIIPGPSINPFNSGFLRLVERIGSNTGISAHCFIYSERRQPMEKRSYYSHSRSYRPQITRQATGAPNHTQPSVTDQSIRPRFRCILQQLQRTRRRVTWLG